MRVRLLGIIGLAGVVAAAAFGLFVVPADLNQGDAQRIMYVHVASAWLAYLSFGVTALAGMAYLWRRDLRFDAVAVAGAEIGVMFTAFAIWGGMMWGRPVWGVFWQWEDPRLTTTALLAAVDIPIVHFSVEWWRGLHQGPTIGSPDKILNPSAPGLFVIALVSMVAAFTLVWSYLMIRRYQLARVEWQIEEHGRLGRISAARRAASARAASVPAPSQAEEGAR